MTRRKPGAGGVDKLPSGRWRVRLRADDARQMTLGTYDTEAEAEAVRAQGLAQLVARGAAPTGPLTLRAWGKTWHAKRVADGIRSADKEHLVWCARVAESELGDLPVRELTRQHVLAWLDRVRASKVHRPSRNGLVATDATIARGTVRHALHVLRSALQAARDAGHLVGDPTDGVRVPRGTVTAKAAEPWTWLRPAEVDAVTTCPRYDLEHRTIYAVAVYTGLRQGEMWALRWERLTLDGDAPEVLVSESHGGPPKNGKVRRVPLLPAAVSALRAWRAVAAESWRESRGTLDGFGASYVFPSESGGRRAQGDDARWAPQSRWTRADGTASAVAGYRERAGITRKVRFHDLRHTCASHLLQGTWGVTLTLMEVKDWLGHSSVTMTERYAHLCADRLASKVATATRGAHPRDSHRDSRASHGAERSARNPFSTARPEGVEPPTDGSEVRGGVLSFRGDTVKHDSLVAHATAFLMAAARGESSAEARVTLARAAIVEGLDGATALRALDGDHDAAVTLALALMGGAVSARRTA